MKKTDVQEEFLVMQVSFYYSCMVKVVCFKILQAATINCKMNIKIFIVKYDDGQPGKYSETIISNPSLYFYAFLHACEAERVM